MKHTKKLIAVLICIAMLPWTLIPVFADDSAPVDTDVLYSMTFDNSGDEATKLAGWSTAAYTTGFAGDGYLQLNGASVGWGDVVAPNAGTIPSSDTFTASVTYRHSVAPDSNAHSVALMFGTKEAVSFRAYEDKSWYSHIVDGATALGNWGENGVNHGADQITKEYVDAMIEQKWITITIEVDKGTPVSLTFATEGLDDLEFAYDGVGSLNGFDAKDFGLRFKGSTVEVSEIAIDCVIAPDLETPALPTAPDDGGDEPDEPSYVRPEITQPADAGTVLYEVTFDKSGDEADKLANFTGAHTLTIQDSGLLRVDKKAGWDKTTVATGIAEGTTTFTAQLTYRFLSNTATNGGVSMGFSTYELGWRRQLNSNHSEPIEGGSAIVGDFGDATASDGWAGRQIPADIVSAWNAPDDPLAEFTGVPSTWGEWVTITLEVENGVPAYVHIKAGDQEIGFEYSGYHASNFETSPIDASSVWFYFSNAGVDIYDYRIVSGTQLQTLGTPALPAEGGDTNDGGNTDNGGSTNNDANTNDNTTETTDAVAETAAAAEETTDAAEEKKGCGASAASALAVMMVVLSIGACVCVKRKKVTD